MKQYTVKRKRNKLVNFWVTHEEIELIEARVKLTGMAKGEYLIETLLKQDISIRVGKYESDCLSLEMARLNETLNTCDVNSEEGIKVLKECRILFQELLQIMNRERDEHA